MKVSMKPVLTLFFLSAILAELLSGSSPATIFFNPPFLLLQLISYGIPALVIRELSVRWQLKFTGIFILALGYGIFNEGLLAGTFFLRDASFFKGYGYYLGLNFAWIPFAATWHSLHSIVYPMLITHSIYPNSKNEPWFSLRTTKILSVIAILETAALYFAPAVDRPTPYFLILWLSIIIIALVAKRFSGSIENKSTNFSLGAFFIGFLSVSTYFVLIAITNTKIPLFMYWLILIGFIFIFWMILKRKRWNTVPAILSFVAGDYFGNGIFAIIGRGGALEVILTSLIATAWVIYIARKNSKDSNK